MKKRNIIGGMATTTTPTNKLRLRNLRGGVPVPIISMATPTEVQPLTSTSPQPSLFDGTTRLYISYRCPYAQRVWITRNCTAFDYLETVLSKYDHGPFFLGHFSLVDIAYAPFIERFQPFLADVKNYDITIGRPKLAAWIEGMNNIDGYKVTRSDAKELVESYKKRFLVPQD